MDRSLIAKTINHFKHFAFFVIINRLIIPLNKKEINLRNMFLHMIFFLLVKDG